MNSDNNFYTIVSQENIHGQNTLHVKVGVRGNFVRLRYCTCSGVDMVVLE